MSDAQIKALIWVVIIGLICYLFSINLAHAIGALFHAAQQMHNSNSL